MSRVQPVGVRLAAPRGKPLAVIRARQALCMPDHVRERDAVAVHQPERQLQRGAHLPWVVEDRRVARADVLDADRGPVEADGVAADRRQRDELVDRAVAVDHEVRARSRQLAAAPGRAHRTRTCSTPTRRSCSRCSARRSRAAGRAARCRGRSGARRSCAVSARRAGPNGIGFETIAGRGGATAATSSTAKRNRTGPTVASIRRRSVRRRWRWTFSF